jgi:pimeloyl-ACP methyl ester carboxylesterase
MPSPIRQYYFDTYQATRIDLNWHVIQQLHVINRQGQGSFKYRYPIDDILPTIDKPGLIIWGMSDSLLSPKIPSLMQVYAPHLELYQIHNSGHTPMLESPKKTALAIERFITAQK